MILNSLCIPGLGLSIVQPFMTFLVHDFSNFMLILEQMSIICILPENVSIYGRASKYINIFSGHEQYFLVYLKWSTLLVLVPFSFASSCFIFLYNIAEKFAHYLYISYIKQVVYFIFILLYIFVYFYLHLSFHLFKVFFFLLTNISSIPYYISKYVRLPFLPLHNILFYECDICKLHRLPSPSPKLNPGDGRQMEARILQPAVRQKMVQNKHAHLAQSLVCCLQTGKIEHNFQSSSPTPAISPFSLRIQQ